MAKVEMNGSIYIYPCLGDFDGDGDVDVIDIQRIAYRWNSKVGDPLYDPLYDLDKDGDIDIVDVQRVAYRWGTTCGAIAVDRPQPVASSDQTASSQAVTLAIDPPDLTITVGQTFTVDVIGSEMTDLGAFEFTLAYSSAVMEAIDVVLGDFPGSTGRNVVSLNPVIDVQQGSVSFGAYSLGAQPTGPNGTGVLASVTFRANVEGVGGYTFAQAQISDRTGDSQTIGQTTGGQVQVQTSGEFNYLPLVIK